MYKFLYQNLPVYAPNGFGGMSDIRMIDQPIDQIDDDDSGGGDDRQQQQQRRQTQEVDDISLENTDALRKLFDDQDDTDFDLDLEDDSDEDDDKESKKKKAPASEDDDEDSSDDDSAAFAEQLNAAITGLTTPKDLIPADFDPNDPAQLTSVLGSLQQATARSTLNLSIGVMSRALASHKAQLTEQFQQAIRDNGRESKVQEKLSEAIPEYNDPELRSAVRTIYKQASLRHTKPAAAIAATKQALATLGIKLSGDRKSDNNRQNRSSSSGSLDNFFDMPSANRGNARDRMRRNT